MNNPLYEQINVIGKDYVLSKIDQFLSEDSPNGDPTTQLTVDNKKNTSALFICEDECVFAGEQILYALDDDIKINIFAKDGTELRKGQKIAQIDGNARQLLKLERILGPDFRSITVVFIFYRDARKLSIDTKIVRYIICTSKFSRYA